MIAAWSRWSPSRVACALAVAAVAGTLAGCGAGGAPGTAAAGSRTASSPPPASVVPASAAACEARVYDHLTLAQRVGQLFIVGVPSDIAGARTRAAVDQYHFGSVLLPQSAAGTAALAAATSALQALAPGATGGVRFLVAANQEGGEVQQLTGPGFTTMPSALTQGTWPAGALRTAAAGWGGELRAAGVNLDMAPVMGVVPAATAAGNAPIGALHREFGYTPAVAGAHGAAFIKGMASAGVATMAKHFPGLGRVTANTDFTANVTDTVTTPGDPGLGSFRAAVQAGTGYVMVALATYTRIDASRLAVFSPVVMRLLRGAMGFGGVIVSDDLGDARAVQAVPAGDRAIGFLDAGGDMITSQSIGPAEQMAAAVLARASGSAAFRATVDGAVRRVLAAKRVQGLLPCAGGN